jgi:X-Pro dipeptidyl-peptidase
MAIRRCLFALCLVLSALVPHPAAAKSAPDQGVAWEPRVMSKALYGTQPPDEDPDRQRHYVEAHDGVDLYVETWLPTPKGGKKPPAKIPTILIMTPYVWQGQEEYPQSGPLPPFIDYYTQRGYAVAQHHVRGTGESGGCLEQTAKNQIKDGAYVIEYLGREAPWSNGRVGMYGASYDAETQISTAGFGEPKRIKYLKAIIPTASVGSQYDWNFMDGVPWFGQPLVGNTAYLAGVSMFPGQEPAPQHYPEKLQCQDEVMLESANTTGDYTNYWKEREYRPGADEVKAATLMVHGLRDFNVQDITLAGFFDRLPATTPHKGLFGVWNHAFPGNHSSVEPAWNRDDWYDMVTSWFDRYLKGLPTKVEKWPDVQVQSSSGQWWVANEFPTTRSPLGHLGLGPNGQLGVARPEGETIYTEQLAIGFPLPNQQAVFETPKLKAPLHITGQPMLDLWLLSSASDGHVGASLEVIGADGQPLRHEGSRREFHATYGVRSLQHLEPMRRGWFEQKSGKPVEPGKPVHAVVRFLPTDLYIPKGGSLRLTISGSVSYSKGDSLPSGASSTITLLHNCKHTSALRFRMPNPQAKMLNVREADEKTGRLTSKPARMGLLDGGVARKQVCDARPRPLPFL